MPRNAATQLILGLCALALSQGIAVSARASCTSDGLELMTSRLSSKSYKKNSYREREQILHDLMDAQHAKEPVALTNAQGQVLAKGSVIMKDGKVFVTSTVDGTTVVRDFRMKEIGSVKPLDAIPKAEVETILGKFGQDQAIKVELRNGNEIRTIRGKIDRREGDVLIVRPNGKTAAGGPKALVEIPVTEITGLEASRATTASINAENAPIVFAASVSNAEKSQINAMGEGKTIDLATVGKTRKVGKGDEILIRAIDEKGPKRRVISQVVADENGVEYFVLDDGNSNRMYLPASHVSEIGQGKERPLVERQMNVQENSKPPLSDADEIAKEEARKVAEREALEKAENDKAAMEAELKKIDEEYKARKLAREIAEREALEKSKAEHMRRAEALAEDEIELMRISREIEKRRTRQEAAKKLAQKNAATRAKRRADVAAGLKVDPTLAQFKENAVFAKRGLLPDGRPITSEAKKATLMTEYVGGKPILHIVEQVIVEEHEPLKILGVRFKDGQLKRPDELADWKLGINTEERAKTPAQPPPIPAAARARKQVPATQKVEQFYVTSDGRHVEPGTHVLLDGGRGGAVEKIIRTKKGNLAFLVKVDGTDERVILSPSKAGSLKKPPNMPSKPNIAPPSVALSSSVVPSAIAADGRLFRGGAGVVPEETTVLRDPNGEITKVTQVVKSKGKDGKLLGVRTSKEDYLSAEKLKDYTALTSKIVRLPAGSTITDPKGLMHNVDAIIMDEATKEASTIRLSDKSLISTDELDGYQLDIDYNGPGMPGFPPKASPKQSGE